MGLEYVLGIFLICCGSFLGPGTGIEDGELHGCPPTPNCVSSESWKYNYIHKIEPIYYMQSREETYHFLAAKFDGMENVYVSEKKKMNTYEWFILRKFLGFPTK